MMVSLAVDQLRCRWLVDCISGVNDVIDLIALLMKLLADCEREGRRERV